MPQLTEGGGGFGRSRFLRVEHRARTSERVGHYGPWPVPYRCRAGTDNDFDAKSSSAFLPVVIASWALVAAPVTPARTRPQPVPATFRAIPPGKASHTRTSWKR
jgi:hypothetical protein